MRSLLLLVLVGCTHPTPPASRAPEPASSPVTPLSDAAVAIEPAPPVVDAARPAVVEDPTLSCVDKDIATCHWVEMWRRYLTEQLKLPKAWVAAHIKVDKIDLETRSTSIVIDFTITVDWVAIHDDERIQIREESGQLSTEDQIWARFAKAELFIKPFKVAITHAKALAALAKCHGATEGSPVILNDKTVILRGSIADASRENLCWGAELDLETGKLTSCASLVCAMY